MSEIIDLPSCKKCYSTVDVWIDECITDACQKPYRALNGKEGVSNVYEFVCPKCGTKQSFAIEVDADAENDYTGKVMLATLSKWLSFPVF